MKVRIAVLLFVIVAFCGIAEASVYNLHLSTDSAPDYTDLQSFVDSATGAWQTPQDKCIAIWRWARRSRRQTRCAMEDGRLIWDPILHYNSYGAMNCGIVSSLNIACWRQLGYRARYVQLGDHTVSEVSWDDGKSWHLFDSSMSVFCFNHAGEVASCQEIKEAHACELSGGKREQGHYYLYHYAPQCASHPGPTGWRCASDQPVGYNRTLSEGASSYFGNFAVDRYCQYARYGQRYTLNLRPYESYARYWTPLDPAKDSADPVAKDLAYFRPMADGSDPNNQHSLKNIRGNGRWLFMPDLSARDCRLAFYDDSAVALRAEDGAGPRLHPAKAGTDAWAIFKVYAANVITAIRIEASGVRQTDADVLRVSISRDGGLHWSPVWQAERTGEQSIRVTLRAPVAGVTQCLVKIEMRAARDKVDVGLESFEATTITQLNRRTLPRLSLGANQVLLRADEQVESAELWPPLHGGAYRRTAAEENNVYSDKEPDGMYKATLGAGANGRECAVTWRVAVPSDITSIFYGVVSTNRSEQSSVSLLHSWDGAHFQQFHLKKDGGFPMDEQVLRTFTGGDVSPGARQVSFRAAFSCKDGAATYNMPGIQELLIRVNHKPRDPGFQPIEVTYHWTEHRETGDVERGHTALIRSLPLRYSINVAGRRDPTMHSVRINLQGYGPEGRNVRHGYSDGKDVGPGDGYAKVVYRWGKSLADGKPYTASRESSSRLGDPDTDGRELTNGIVIAPTDQARSRAVQAATAFWDPGEPVSFVVDLRRPQQIGGVRITTHQPNAQLCHPKSIDVAASADGQAWWPMGAIRHDDLWKPPGDYEAWEHDDDPSYASLPARGRLAYSYPLAFPTPVEARYVRFVSTPLEGKGMGLSEFQVFDQVNVVPWPAEIRLPDAAPTSR
ncbi:MAG: hypothetical protein NTU53_17950 [Planctomycetota bacterium]|nr:hypothetical protein [Planctomycetota bacterium]